MDDKYKKMWKRLEELVDKNLESYESGVMMSMAESVWGSEVYKEVQELMRRVEREVILNAE